MMKDVMRHDGVRINLALALSSLVPGAKFVILGNKYENIEWLSKDLEIPSKESVEIELDRLIEEYEKTQYRHLRGEEYPNWSDQLELLWDDIDSGVLPGKDTSKWYLAIKEIKDKYPKPE